MIVNVVQGLSFHPFAVVEVLASLNSIDRLTDWPPSPRSSQPLLQRIAKLHVCHTWVVESYISVLTADPAPYTFPSVPWIETRQASHTSTSSASFSAISERRRSLCDKDSGANGALKSSCKPCSAISQVVQGLFNLFQIRVKSIAAEWHLVLACSCCCIKLVEIKRSQNKKEYLTGIAGFCWGSKTLSQESVLACQMLCQLPRWCVTNKHNIHTESYRRKVRI